MGLRQLIRNQKYQRLNDQDKPSFFYSRSTRKMKKLIVTGVAVAIAIAIAYRWQSSREAERFIAEKKAEFSGYRVEYFEHERLLFLHSPDGSKTGVDMAKLRRAHLYRRNAADSTNNQKNYYWRIDAPPTDLFIPYFSIEPLVILEILKKEHPEIDVEESLKHARDFERNKFNFCTIWAPSGSKEIETERGYSVCAPSRK